MATGWTKYSGNTYYYTDKGYRLHGKVKVSNVKYYFDTKTGVLKTCWSTENGKKHYYDASGEAKGEKKINDKWYYFNSNGEMQTGFVKINKSTYYYSEDGAKCFGEKKIKDNTYYFDTTTGAMKTGWLKRSGKTYYYNSKGCMVYGMKDIDGNTYFFNTKTGVMQTGWKKISGHRYYFYSNGKMAKDTTIDGITINSKGRLSGAYAYAESVLNDNGWSLKAAFNWSASMTYKKDSVDASRGSEAFALNGFKTGKGNCYGMAATFYCMAKVLGYDAHQVSGYVPLRGGGQGPHSWVEIKIDGTVYVFDPDFTHETGRNGYKISYGTSGTWRYSNYHRMN